MASEFIEVISEQTKAQIDAIMPLVRELANEIKTINGYKASSTPSGADKGIKGMTDAYKAQSSELEQIKKKLAMISSLNKQRYQEEAKLIADHDKALIFQSQNELKQEKKAADESIKTSKAKLSMISSLNKQRYSEEAKLAADAEKAMLHKYQEELKQIKAKQAMIYSLGQQQLKEEAQNAKWSRTGASSVIPGMAGKISDLKETEKTVLANEKLSRAYVQLTANREKAKQKLQDLIAAEKSSNSEIRKAQKEFDVLNKKVAAADKAVGRFSDANRKINGLASSVGNLMTAFGVGTGLFLAVDIAKNIFNTTLALQEMDLSLNAVSGSLKKFEENSAFLKRISVAYGGNIEKLTHSFVQFYASAKDKIAEREIKNIFESITKSGAFLGLSMERQERGFLALQQMMSKTTVMAEELRGQLSESLPNAVGTMTKAYQNLHPEMKVTEKFFLEQVKAGKVLSAEILPEYAKQLEISLGIENTEKINTARVAIGRLKLAWIQLIKAVTESNLGSITGQTFAGMSIIGTALLNKIKRGFQNVGQLSAEAMQKGMEEGRESAEKGIYDETIDKRLNKAREQIKKAQKEYLAENLALQANKRKLRFTPKTALNEQMIKDLEQQIEQGSNIVGFWKGYVEQSAEIIKELKSPKVGAEATKTKAQIEAEKREREKRLKAIEEANKLSYDLKMAQLEKDKIILEQGLNNEKLNYSERLNFAYLIASKELEMAELKYKEEQRLSEGNNDKLMIADINFWKDKEKVAKEAIKRIQDVQFKPQYERQQLADSDKYGEGVGMLGKGQTQDMVNLWQKGQDKIKETEEERIKRLKALREVLNDVFKEFGQATGFESTMNMFAVIGKNGEDFWTNLTDKKKVSEIEWNEWGLAITTVAQDAMNLIDQADEARYQRRLARLEKEKEVALSFAGDSAAAKEKIEADYEKKRKALEIKEFKRKQKVAMANIAIDTAQAIMAVVAKSGNLWESIVVGALGAVQLAMVASQKPPEYWTGTDNAEAGLAWTQERGSEIITNKQGVVKDFGDNKGARLTMMEAGDKVYNAEQTKRLMFNNELNSILMDNQIGNAPKVVVNSGMTKADLREVMLETLGEQPQYHTNITEGGITNLVIRNGNITKTNSARGNSIKTRFN